MKHFISIDTNVFFSRHFDYSNAAFEVLKKRVREDLAAVVLTTVVVEECRSNIRSLVEVACNQLKKGQREASILRFDAACEGVLAPIDKDARIEEALRRFDGFLSEINATIVNIKTVDAEDVFNDYFNHAPPFESGKKKSEFPDAFSIKALKDWAQNAGVTVYVVSDDRGVLEACESPALIGVSRLEECLEIIANFDARVLNPLREQIAENAALLTDAVKLAFENFGFYLEDQEGDVHSVDVNEVEFGDWSIINIEENAGSAACQSVAMIKFSADLEYDDLENAIWDSEDKRYYALDRVSMVVDQEIELNITFQLKFNLADSSQFLVEQVGFEDDSDIGIYVQQYDEYM